MTHLYLIRHAESIEGELGDGKYGDLGLAPEGMNQAERLRDRLSASGEIKPDVFIASTARRAHETAQILAPAFDTPLALDPDFEEWRCDDGTLSPDEFMARWNAVSKEQKPYFRWMEGYESRVEFTLRVNLTLNRTLQAHAGKTLVVVSHGAFIQLSFGFFFGFGEANLDRAMPEVRRTSITHWVLPAGDTRWTLERSNDCHHLD